MVVEFHMDDLVELRKPHPCGGVRWRVVRLGADIGLRCETCGHRVLLERRMLEHRLKAFIERGPSARSGIGRAPAGGPSEADGDPLGPAPATPRRMG